MTPATFDGLALEIPGSLGCCNPLPPSSTAIEASFNARRHIWSAADVAYWWPEVTAGSRTAKNLRVEQNDAFGRRTQWVGWARRMYDPGLLALLLGLSSAIPPPPGIDTEAPLRWVASGAVCAASVAELAWMIVGAVARSSKG